MTDYICIRKGTEETDNCKGCGGLTNICGKYKNKMGTNPFERFYSRRKKDKDEVRNGFCLEIRSKAGADNKVEHMPVFVDNHADNYIRRVK